MEVFLYLSFLLLVVLTVCSYRLLATRFARIAFSLVLLNQIFSLILIGIMVFNAYLRNIYLLGMALFILLCMLSDWSLFRLIRKLQSQQELREELAVMEHDLSLQQQRSDKLLADAEHLQNIRHDFNNQLQTAALLLERGESDQVKQLLLQLRSELTPLGGPYDL